MNTLTDTNAAALDEAIRNAIANSIGGTATITYIDTHSDPANPGKVTRTYTNGELTAEDYR